MIRKNEFMKHEKLFNLQPVSVSVRYVVDTNKIKGINSIIIVGRFSWQVVDTNKIKGINSINDSLGKWRLVVDTNKMKGINSMKMMEIVLKKIFYWKLK